MSTEQQEQKYEVDPEKRLDEARAARDEGERTPKPEVTEEHKEKAKEMAESYREDRPTVAMPGTGGTVAGTAVADWVDADKNPDKGSKKDPDKD